MIDPHIGLEGTGEVPCYEPDDDTLPADDTDFLFECGIEMDRARFSECGDV